MDKEKLKEMHDLKWNFLEISMEEFRKKYVDGGIIRGLSETAFIGIEKYTFTREEMINRVAFYNTMKKYDFSSLFFSSFAWEYRISMFKSINDTWIVLMGEERGGIYFVKEFDNITDAFLEIIDMQYYMHGKEEFFYRNEEIKNYFIEETKKEISDEEIVKYFEPFYELYKENGINLEFNYDNEKQFIRSKKI